MWKFNNTMALILLAIIGGSVLIIILLFNSFGPSFDVKAGLSKNHAPGWRGVQVHGQYPAGFVVVMGVR